MPGDLWDTSLASAALLTIGVQGSKNATLTFSYLAKAAGRVEEPNSSPARSVGVLGDGQICAVNESDVTDSRFDTRSSNLKYRAETVAARTDTIHYVVRK